jgi:hypothetical protein
MIFAPSCEADVRPSCSLTASTAFCLGIRADPRGTMAAVEHRAPGAPGA